jgi:Ca2+-binding EF-hand superfamily protein
VVDINSDHKLDPCEVKVLLWLTEGIEPTEKRVAKEMAIMDHDKNGSISLQEWIEYVCAIDSVTGNLYFDYELKRKFDVYDTNNSGTIEKEELKNLLADMAAELYGASYKENKEKVDEILTILSIQMMKQMDDNKDSEVSWNEFKIHFAVVSKDIQKLKILG